MTREQIIRAIDEAIAPAKMGPGKALEWLEQLSTEIEMRMDGIKDDMRAKGQDWG